MHREVFAAVADALERGEPAALVTIVSTTGSTPQRVGAKMLVFADGRIVGTIGGGCYENDAFGKARLAIADRKSSLVHYELSDDFAQETGLVCGGQMDVYIEPIEPSPDRYVRAADIAVPWLDWQPGESCAYLRCADGRPHPARPARARPCADWPRHRRHHAAGNRRQHPRRAHRHQARKVHHARRGRDIDAVDS